VSPALLEAERLDEVASDQEVASQLVAVRAQLRAILSVLREVEPLLEKARRYAGRLP